MVYKTIMTFTVRRFWEPLLNLTYRVEVYLAATFTNQLAMTVCTARWFLESAENLHPCCR